MRRSLGIFYLHNPNLTVCNRAAYSQTQDLHHAIATPGGLTVYQAMSSIEQNATVQKFDVPQPSAGLVMMKPWSVLSCAV